jgi:hypothetical protein
MPNRIVTETCPAPKCNLTDQDIHCFMNEMIAYIDMFRPAFQRTEQLEWSQNYLQGLLGNAMRKHIEQMALELGENVRSMQYFMGNRPKRYTRSTALIKDQKNFYYPLLPRYSSLPIRLSPSTLPLENNTD